MRSPAGEEAGAITPRLRALSNLKAKRHVPVKEVVFNVSAWQRIRLPYTSPHPLFYNLCNTGFCNTNTAHSLNPEYVWSKVTVV